MEVVVVLDLVPEEGTRAVDLLTSDNGDLLASEDLIIEEKKNVSVHLLTSCHLRVRIHSPVLHEFSKVFLSTLTLVTTITRPSHTVQDSSHFLRKYSQKH